VRDYNDYIESDVDHKDTVNDMVCSTISKMTGGEKLPENDSIIVLDGPYMNTTRKLLASGLVKGIQIHIIEVDLKTHLLQKASGLANCYHSKLENFLKSNPKNVIQSIRAAFIDAMGMPEGNYTKCLYPMENLMILLQKCCAKRLVLCTTFCFRSKGLFLEYNNMQEQIYDGYIVPCFKWCQYKSINRNFYSYKRNHSNGQTGQKMLFMTFELEKDGRINKNDAVFIKKEVMIDGEYREIFAGYSPDHKV